MEFDITKNQHYVSQSELRLSSINPGLENKLQKIYKFSIVNRENFQLSAGKKILISSVLSHSHLYSFGFEGGSFRNLERLFGVYEVDNSALTKKILDKDYVDAVEVFDVMQRMFCLKWLNVVRNPFGIKQTLAFSSVFKGKQPGAEDLQRVYQLIDAAPIALREHISNSFGVSLEEYEEWLKILFLMLMDVEDGETFLIGLVRRIFKESSIFVSVFVFTYDNEICLISDRGHAMPGDDTYLFNLSKNAFAIFSFADMTKSIGPYRIRDDQVRNVVDKGLNMKVSYFHEDKEALANYNGHVVYQCFANVFSAEKNPTKIQIG